MDGNATSFAGNVSFLFPSWKLCTGERFNPFFRNFLKPLTPLTRKSGFFQRKSRKRVKESREVTFMKEWMKALVDTIQIFWHQLIKKSLLVSKLWPFEDAERVQITFPLHILGPAKLKILRTNCPFECGGGPKAIWAMPK